MAWIEDEFALLNLHRTEERLAGEGMPAADHALAQRHGIPLAGRRLHEVGMTDALQRTAMTELPLAEHRINLLGQIRAEDAL